MSETPASAASASDAPAFRSIADLVALCARAAPRANAIIDATETLDYAALDALIDRVAAALQRDGIAPGEAVAVCAANCARYAAVFLGALRAGAALAPLSPSSTPATFDAMLRDKGGKLRLMYEANPMALLIEQAGGAASTGYRRILDIMPARLHQRVPVILGSKNEVERVVGYHG